MSNSANRMTPASIPLGSDIPNLRPARQAVSPARARIITISIDFGVIGCYPGDMRPLPSLQEKVADALSLISEQLPTDAQACVTASFQAEGMVLIHLLRQQRPDI